MTLLLSVLNSICQSCDQLNILCKSDCNILIWSALATLLYQQHKLSHLVHWLNGFYNASESASPHFRPAYYPIPAPWRPHVCPTFYPLLHPVPACLHPRRPAFYQMPYSVSSPQNWGFRGKIGKGMVRYWPQRCRFYFGGVTSVPLLAKIGQEMRPW